ncbi:DUF418 domain-containing protein [Thermus tengchongensis]|uniref:DUF418 domain-containing protein n=1 Tax=Thermus tengchongensis TaxID=1214928 RepID=UPI002DD41DC6|nr:DUF418 domain-containing protein [Thermus tengchongensis]
MVDGLEAGLFRRVLGLFVPPLQFPQGQVTGYLRHGRRILQKRVSPGPPRGRSPRGVVLQVALAHLWLLRFPQGPLEWLWRRLAYGG